MSSEPRDLTIETLLSDPMIRAANTADHVSLQDFETLLRATARDLRASPRHLWPSARAPHTPPSCCDHPSACYA